MRLGLAVAAIAAVLVPSVSLAAGSRICTGIELLSPQSGQHFIGTRPIHFSWSGEPVGTASRALHLAALDGSETVIPLHGRFSATVKVRMTGDLGWVVVFKDANGKVLCTSPAGLIAAGRGGGAVATAGGESLSTTVSGAAAAKLVVFMNNGRLVIVLQNSPYTGAYTKLVLSDDYDGRSEDLQGSSGLEIHGNDARNKIFGSSGNDLIYAYGSADFVNPGPGTDIVDFGTTAPDIFGEASNSADGEVDVITAPVFTQVSGPNATFGESAGYDPGVDQFIVTP